MKVRRYDPGSRFPREHRAQLPPFGANVAARRHDDPSATRGLSPDSGPRRPAIKIDCGKQGHAEFNKEMENI